MENRILFINKRAEMCDQFTSSMEDMEWEVDTATEGLDAVSYLKKNQYKVVITGMMLKTFDGERLITYLNKSKPDTVIIVYTANVTPADLYFLYNERNVYKVFVRPKSFQGEFKDAIEAAIELYDCRHITREEKERSLEIRRKQEEDLNGVKRQLKHLSDYEKECSSFFQFVQGKGEGFLNEAYSEEETKKILEYEAGIMGQYHVGEVELSELEGVRQVIKEQFPERIGKSMDFSLPSIGIKYTSVSLEKMRYLIEVLVYSWERVFEGYRLHIKIDMMTGSILSLAVRFEQYKEEWDIAYGEPLRRAYLEIAKSLCETLAKDCRVEVKPTSVAFNMEVEMERK